MEMTKEKLVSLNRYLDDLTNKLNSLVPAKHAKHPDTYKQFLSREIEAVKAKLERAKLEGTTK
jgi:hypothetical protein